MLVYVYMKKGSTLFLRATVVVMGLIVLALCIFVAPIISNEVSEFLLIPIAKFLYSSFSEASAKQATIGKRLLDIKVTDMMGERVELGVSFGRNLAKTISVFPLFFGYLYSFLNKKQQCWHDVIANTLVVKQRLI